MNREKEVPIFGDKRQVKVRVFGANLAVIAVANGPFLSQSTPQNLLGGVDWHLVANSDLRYSLRKPLSRCCQAVPANTKPKIAIPNSRP
jgi:hypothetical protein